MLISFSIFDVATSKVVAAAFHAYVPSFCISKGSSTGGVLSGGYSTYSCPVGKSSERMKHTAIDGDDPKLAGHGISTPSGIESGTVGEIVAPTVIDARWVPVDYVFVRIFTNCFETAGPCSRPRENFVGRLSI